MSNSTTYLLSGSTGFLGSVMMKGLLDNGNKVVSIGRSASNDIVQDLSQSFLFDGNEHLTNVDAVIHAAGKAHSVPKTKVEQDLFFEANFLGTKNLCTAIENLKVKPKAFIFISSVAVYGLERGVNIDENYPLNGKTAYALSKIEAEKFLHTWAKKNEINLSILRLPLVAGQYPPGNLGAMMKGIRKGLYLSIGKADAKKSMVWADDILSIIPKLTNIGGVYNLSDGYHPTFAELENAIAFSMGVKSPTRIPLWTAEFLAFIGDFLGRKAPLNTRRLKQITSTLIFSDSKARDLLKWNPNVVVEKINTLNH